MHTKDFPTMKRLLSISLFTLSAGLLLAAGDYPFQPAEMNDVAIREGFWLSRFETNRIVTVWTDFKKSEETGRIDNFAKAARREQGHFRGIPFDDSDVFKIVEGAAYTLGTHPDPKLDKYLDDLIAKMAGAQEEDGYLYTARAQGFTNGMTGPERWTNVGSSHELYNVGHMYEAAAAHYAVTGKKTLLNVATKNADLLYKTFGLKEGQLRLVPGHEEIEIGLCKLYRATGERRYLDLAKTFLDLRGRKDLRGKIFGAYCQDHLPVTEQKEAVGHAVRAGYLYAGMADVAALTGDPSYVEAINTIWENVVSKKLHLNGGIGARHAGEAFGDNYELPNESAYLETCAAIANAFWNQRMFLMTGDAKYVDVLERVIYNGFLSGISLGGDEFFYPNPLASRGGYARSKWFGCSCCPVNIVRFIPQIAAYTYAHRADALYWNLFVASDATIKLDTGKVALSQRTAYPWKGEATMTVSPETDGATFTLNVRIPGWAVGRPVPSDLYTQVTPGTLKDVTVTVNGEAVPLNPVKGYCAIRRAWKKGDTVKVTLAMPVRRIRAHEQVKDDINRLAIERGPIVYCAEGADNSGHVLDKVIAADAVFTETTCDILGNVFPAFNVPATSITRTLKGTTQSAPATVKLIPYFAWCHRGAGEMQTWFPTVPEAADAPSALNPQASHCFNSDTPAALCDNRLPKNSIDHGIPRLTFWPHKGTDEWVQYSFPEPETVKETAVYWFDDTGKGSCALRAMWKVLYRETATGEWKEAPVESYPIQKDTFCKVTFTKPVTAQAIRLAIKLKADLSAGILEWQIR
ncbi:MAG: glycoside hydrolase family 127 protein [Kiritimatiellae bacterium]|nr:glycoside hydrolase family 127 protein [Kiritimatiellia bacterium]